MNKTPVLFAAAFLAGASATLALRASLYRPYAGPPPPATPAPAPATVPDAAAHAAGHAAAAPVNTLCAVCGMDVDSEIPTATYKGKAIGFGCATCPPKFAADPERYGPYALKNERAP